MICRTRTHESPNHRNTESPNPNHLEGTSLPRTAILTTLQQPPVLKPDRERACETGIRCHAPDPVPSAPHTQVQPTGTPRPQPSRHQSSPPTLLPNVFFSVLKGMFRARSRPAPSTRAERIVRNKDSHTVGLMGHFRRSGAEKGRSKHSRAAEAAAWLSAPAAAYSDMSRPDETPRGCCAHGER